MLTCSLSISQSKPVTPRRSWGTPEAPTDASVVVAAHRRLSSATWSSDDNDGYSLIIQYILYNRWV